MKNILMKFERLHWLALLLIVTSLLSSCTKMDDYKKFAEGGEISYTGKLDSIKIMSGSSRVLLTGLFLSDPKITKCKVYWNNMADSVIIPVTRKNVVDSLSFSIDNLKEGVQNFTIYTVDNSGNKSIPVYKTGRVYGARYQASLSNRIVSSALTLQSGVTQVVFEDMDRLTGVFATDVTYTTSANVIKTIRVPINTDTTLINDFKLNTSISYRTLFLPDTVSIDTFKTELTNLYVPRYIKEDVTSTYLVNTGSPINYSSVNSANRWGILSGWTTSASVKNASGFGGYENRSGTGYISLEAGWGLPDITNGLIYQTINLPAGTYAMEAGGIEQNTGGGSRYLAVAEGTTLPAVSNITAAIASTSLIAATTTLNFTLAQSKTLSVGFAANMTGGTGSAGFYTKVKTVRLYRIVYQ